jgi:manganese-dependent ADP-ribose/CDP-alcohol diphosphatase
MYPEYSVQTVRSPLNSSSLFTFLFIIAVTAAGQSVQPVRIGIFTDCQYCDCPNNGVRQYRGSLAKLDSCIMVFNSSRPDAVFHLGDMIDHNISSYDSVLPRFKKFLAPLYLSFGNHDYMVKNRYKTSVPDRVGLKPEPYLVDISDWRFIVLNGDDLSYTAPQTKKQKEERDDIIYDDYQRLHLNGMPWNGGIGSDQMKWLDEKLKDSERSGRKVIVFCHFPLFTKEDHNLFNNTALFHLISYYSCVKAYFCGHYHDGSYSVKEGIHLVNFKGMVNTNINAFSVVTLTSDSILIKGYGREIDRKLKIR